MLRLFSIATLAASSLAAVEFNRDVRPILSDRCFTCHGPDKAARKSPLRLDLEASARPKIAEILKRVTTTNAAQRMPPAYLGHDKLPDAEIATLRQWIADGAPYQPHWSLLAPKRAPLPAAGDAAWSRNAIDRFILARLDKEGLRHSSEAPRATPHPPRHARPHGTAADARRGRRLRARGRL